MRSDAEAVQRAWKPHGTCTVTSQYPSEVVLRWVILLIRGLPF